MKQLVLSSRWKRKYDIYETQQEARAVSYKSAVQRDWTLPCKLQSRLHYRHGNPAVPITVQPSTRSRIALTIAT